MSDGESDSNTNLFNSGLNLMKEGRYQYAILEFNQIKGNKDYENKAKVKRATCLYHLQREIEAKKIFEELRDKDMNLFYKGRVHFYLQEYLSSLYYFHKMLDSDSNRQFTLDSNRQFIFFRIGSAYLEFLEELKKFKGEFVQSNNGKYLDKWLVEIRRLEQKEKAEKLEEIEILKELKSDLDYITKDGVEKEEVISFYDKWVSRILHCAMKYLSDGISAEINLPEFFYNKGVALYNIEKYEDAIEAFNEAVERYRPYALAFNNKGNTYVKIERYGDAIEAYTEAIKINPKYSIAYNNRGQVYLYLKDYENALKDFNDSTKFNPADYKAWTNKGAVFFSQKEYVKAKEAYERALDLNPNYILANVSLAKFLLYLGDSRGANERIDKALDLDVRDADSWRLKGQILITDDKYRDAIVAFENAIECSKGDTSLILWKAYAHYLDVSSSESLASLNPDQKKETEIKKPIENISTADKSPTAATDKSSTADKSIADRLLNIPKDIANSLSSKSKNPEAAAKSPEKVVNQFPEFKKEYYSIIRELEIYYSISCKQRVVTRHIILEKLNDLFFWIRKNLELVFLPIIKILMIKSRNFNLQSVNSSLEKYELDVVKAYVLYLLGCLYYKIGDYFEARDKLKECIRIGPKEVRRSAVQLLDYISSNYIRSPWWAWWLSSPTYRWTKRILFVLLSGGFLFLLLFHPFVYPLLYTLLYSARFKNFFTELGVIHINSSSPVSISGSPNVIFNEISNSGDYNNTFIKSNEIFANWDLFTVNSALYYILILVPLFTLFSPHIMKIAVKQGPVEMEMKSPKDFEFSINPCLMDDVVRKIDDIPD